MEHRNKIAVIGLAGIFADAENLDEFAQNLKSRHDSVRRVPNLRLEQLKLDPDLDYQLSGCMECVDDFDFEFFGISRREAEFMDPQHRIALQLACQAIEAAGYSLSSFRNTRTGVLIGASFSAYFRLFQEFDPTALTGNMPAGIAGRIAYQLDLHGPAMLLDTACSSSLVAVHEACCKLRTGEIDFALAGGVSVSTGFHLKNSVETRVGIWSPDGRSRSFDAAANGTGSGEGAGIVLLRRLEDALAAGDIINAVIIGTAINQNGHDSNGMAAPSSIAQADVLSRAWEDAGISPASLSYIEAHGTGTKLGDPVEIQGIKHAFRRFTEQNAICATGSVKSNIGHLDAAAGIAGLIKVILSLREKQIFPSIHFETPNPFIDFSDCPVFVNTALRPWERDTHPRRAAISSFGLSGTNAHMVLEEGPTRGALEKGSANGNAFLVKVSAKNREALQRYCSAIQAWLNHSDASDLMRDIAYTLNCGRDDYPHRCAWIVHSLQEFKEAVAAAIQQQQFWEAPPSRVPKLVLLLASSNSACERGSPGGIGQIVHDRLADLSQKQCDEPRDDRTFRLFNDHCFALCVCDLLGIKPATIIGDGIGRTAAKVTAGQLDYGAALREIARQETPNVATIDVAKTLRGFDTSDELIILRVAPSAIDLTGLSTEVRPIEVIDLTEPGCWDVKLEALLRLYLRGISLNWKNIYTGHNSSRLEMPTYPFAKSKVWCFDPVEWRRKCATRESTPAQSSTSPPIQCPHSSSLEGEEQGAVEILGEIWKEVLGVERVQPGDDFFDLGGNSLIGTQLTTRIRETFNVQYNFDMIYDRSSLKEMAQWIEEEKSRATTGKAESGDDAELQNILEMIDELGEEEAWALIRQREEKSAYSVSHVHGHLEE